MEDDHGDQPDFGGNAFSHVRDNRRRRFAGLFQACARGCRARVAPGAAALFLVALLTGADGRGAFARDYGLVAMNFDLWCQEQAGLPAERCDKRIAADEKAFEDFQQQLGPYEARNLRQAQQEQWLDRDFLDNDPIDNPSAQNPLAAMQSPLPRRVDRQ